VALWQAPTVDGKGVCWFTGTAESPAPHVGLGAGGCRSNAEPRPTGETLSVMGGGDLVSGFLRPDSRIVKVTIRGDGWTVDAAVANDAFLAKLPGGGPYNVSGYDRAGNQLASAHLDNRPGG
jgi:hypothetical protein